MEGIDSPVFGLIIIFGGVILMCVVPVFISHFFSKNQANLNEYENRIYGDILKYINENWEYSYVTKSFNIFNQKNIDYFEAEFPREPGGLTVCGEIKNKINRKENAIHFYIYESGTYGTGTNYTGIYFSIQNNNNVLDNIYIRNKKNDGIFKGELPFSKLDLNNEYYNFYAENINILPNGLIELINNFYVSTNIRCDLTISKDKIQIRFDMLRGWPFKSIKEVLDKEALYDKYKKMYRINEFINQLYVLLSNE